MQLVTTHQSMPSKLPSSSSTRPAFPPLIYWPWCHMVWHVILASLSQLSWLYPLPTSCATPTFSLATLFWHETKTQHLLGRKLFLSQIKIQQWETERADVLLQVWIQRTRHCVFTQMLCYPWNWAVGSISPSLCRNNFQDKLEGIWAELLMNEWTELVELLSSWR